MSDYNDKELWSINRLSWDSVPDNPRRSGISMFITGEAAWYQGRLGKMVGLRLNHSFKRQLRSLSCVHATMH
jgi:hypothetical protein